MATSGAIGLSQNTAIQNSKEEQKKNAAKPGGEETEDLKKLAKDVQKGKEKLWESILKALDQTNKELAEQIKSQPIVQNILANDGARETSDSAKAIKNFFMVIYKYLEQHKSQQSKMALSQERRLDGKEHLVASISKGIKTYIDTMKHKIEKAEKKKKKMKVLKIFIGVVLGVVMAAIIIVVTVASVLGTPFTGGASDVAGAAVDEGLIDATVAMEGAVEGALESATAATTSATAATAGAGTEAGASAAAAADVAATQAETAADTAEAMSDALQEVASNAADNVSDASGLSSNAAQETADQAAEQAQTATRLAQEARAAANAAREAATAAQTAQEGGTAAGDATATVEDSAETVQSCVENVEEINENATEISRSSNRFANMAKIASKNGVSKVTARAAINLAKSMGVHALLGGAGVIAGVEMPMNSAMKANYTTAVNEATVKEQGQVSVSAAAEQSLQSDISSIMQFQQKDMSEEESDASQTKNILQVQANTVFPG